MARGAFLWAFTMTAALNPEGPGVYNQVSAGYKKSLIVKAARGKLYGFCIYNSGAAQFIQVHDAAAVPADGVTPLLSLTVATTGNLTIDFGVHGLQCNTGIVITNSSTGPTKTIGADDCFISAQYY